MSRFMEISEALAAAVTDGTGLRSYAFPVEQVNAPAVIVTPVGVEYRRAMQLGMVEYRYRVAVVTGRANERGGWETLEEFVDATGDRSVFQAIEADPTLDGLVSDLTVTRTVDMGTVMQQDTAYVVATLEVSVYA